MDQARRINPFRWMIIGGGILLLLSLFLSRSSGSPELEISQVIQMAETGQVAKIQVQGDKLGLVHLCRIEAKPIPESSWE